MSSPITAPRAPRTTEGMLSGRAKVLKKNPRKRQKRNMDIPIYILLLLNIHAKGSPRDKNKRDATATFRLKKVRTIRLDMRRVVLPVGLLLSSSLNIPPK